MAEITATMVKSLRDRTGAGMMACREALVKAEGSEEKAVEILQKELALKTVKKAGAIAAEGMIQAYIHPGNRRGVLVEVNCQTDFVGRGEDFRAFVDDVCLQIAANNPQFVRREEVPADAIAKQREIFVGIMKEEDEKSGKSRPEAAVGKILDGKIDKWLSETCLYEQVFIKEETKTIAKLAEELTAKTGEKISVRRFVRFELGEGIEKKTADLAADVAATLQGS